MLIAVFFLIFSISSSAETGKTIDETSVLDDLKSTSINGIPFNFSDYVFNENRKIQVISFIEYGFTYKEKEMNHFGLYVYLFNPAKLNIEERNKENKIQIAIKYDENDKAISYRKFDLFFINKSEEKDYEGMFYKYKVVDWMNELKNTARNSQAQKSYRKYDVSSLELSIKQKDNSVSVLDFDCSASCKFSGFAKGCDLDKTKDSSLECKMNILETIQLDVKSTFYRTESSSLGKDHQNQLTSVYFSIDNSLLEGYGKLQKIKAEWNEQKTSPIIVTSDTEMGYKLRAFMDKNIGEYTDSLDYTLGYDRNSSVSTNITYKWSYNIKNGNIGSILAPCWITSYNQCPIIDYVFLVEDIKKDFISSDMLKNWIKTYNSFEHFFEDEVDEGRTKGYNCVEIDANDTFDLLNYTENHSWWDKVLDYGLWATITGKTPQQGSVYGVEPIYQVKDVDLLSSNSAISNNLLIHENDVNLFKQYYTEAKSKNKSTYLFRFASSDYFSGMLSVEKKGESMVKNNTTYMAQETVFLDFDIIELSFLKEGNYTVIPVVANHIDIIGDIESPKEFENWSWVEILKRTVKIILIVFVCFVLFCVLSPILPYIIQFIIWVISLPIKFIRVIIKLFKKKKE